MATAAAAGTSTETSAGPPRFQPEERGRAGARRRGLQHPLWLHPGVSDELRQWPHLYRRLGLVLEQLAAHGRTSVVKGCRNANRGWLRSPLGGNQGVQYYLWWTHQESRAATGLELPTGSIVVRAVRHHDDHTPLHAGEHADYLTLTTAEDLSEDIAGEPWTADQATFVDGKAPIRLLIGRPGSGKTTALWRAVDARDGEQVLYLTWSTALARHAEEHFCSFAPESVQVHATDFTTFLGEIIGCDVDRQPLEQSRSVLDQAITRAGRNMAGPWASRLTALHAEMRGVLIGRAAPDRAETTAQGDIVRMSDKGYTKHRGTDTGLEMKAVRAVLKVARSLPAGALRAVYPELAAASQAVRRLRNDQLPEQFARIDRIVVDELQDLTVLETAVIVQLCRTIARRRGWAPKLLMAGDAGQTVRPTAFKWAHVSNLLRSELRAPASFYLDEHVRCPKDIAEIVDRSAHLYTGVNKDVRPTKQHKQSGGEHVDAQLIHVQLTDPADIEPLLARLADSDNVAIVATSDTRPAWVPPQWRQSVLTPAQAKGLEYQAVCVLDPGANMATLRDDMFTREGDDIDQELHRAAIDDLRVTLSRATESLIFIDMQPDATALEASVRMLGNAAPYSPQDLIEHIERRDTPPEESVLLRTREATALLDTAPLRAWQRAAQALRMLGDPDLPNGVQDPAVRKAARHTLLATAARLLVTPGETSLTTDEIRPLTSEALYLDVETRNPDGIAKEDIDKIVLTESRIIHLLGEWRTRQEEPHQVLLVDSIATLRDHVETDEDWTRNAIPNIAQALRNGITAGAEDLDHAADYNVEDVSAWLDTTGYTGDSETRAVQLCRSAVDNLLKAARTARGARERRARIDSAQLVLASLEDEPLREGRMHEIAGDPEAAVTAYRKANATADIIRVWRNAGAWEKALIEAEGEAESDLTWLLNLEALVDQRPRGQNRRLRKAERKRLSRVLDRIQKRRGDAHEE